MGSISTKRRISRQARRGFILPLVLGVTAVFAIVAMTLLNGATNASHSTFTIQDKNATFDAAEAGLNAGLDDLDTSLLSAQHSATLANGYSFSYTIYPNFIGTQPLSMTDPISGTRQVFVPAGGAIIYSTGTNPNGDRSTTLEAAVSVDATQLTYPHLAVAAGQNIQGNYGTRGIIDPTGTNSASIQSNGNITATLGGGLQGTAYASGSVNSLSSGNTNAAAAPLPTVSQFDYLVASYKSRAQTFGGPTTLYVAAGTPLLSSYVCPAPGVLLGCLFFYDGPLTLTSQGVTFVGPWTMVVNGDLAVSGNGFIEFSDKPSLLLVNGNAKISGSSAHITGYLQVKGSTTLNGNGFLTGAIMSLGTLTFSGGGGSGGISYDPSAIPATHVLTGLVKIVTYAEY